MPFRDQQAERFGHNALCSTAPSTRPLAWPLEQHAQCFTAPDGGVITIVITVAPSAIAYRYAQQRPGLRAFLPGSDGVSLVIEATAPD